MTDRGSAELFLAVLFALFAAALFGVQAYMNGTEGRFRSEVARALDERYGVQPALGNDGLPEHEQDAETVPLVVDGRTVRCEVEVGNRASELAVFCDGSRVALAPRRS